MIYTSSERHEYRIRTLGALLIDGYHFWLYQHVLNTEWFMWVIVYSVLGTNVAAPVIVWYRLHRNKRNNKARRAGGSR